MAKDFRFLLSRLTHEEHLRYINQENYIFHDYSSALEFLKFQSTPLISNFGRLIVEIFKPGLVELQIVM